MSSLVKIDVVSDTHGLGHLLRLQGGDILIHCGDLTNEGSFRESKQSHRDEVEKCLDWLEVQPYYYKIFIAGNHDVAFAKEKLFVKPLLINRKFIYLEGEYVAIEHIIFCGFPWHPQTDGWVFGMKRDSIELRGMYTTLQKGIDVLITHSPPFNILDDPQKHSGCELLLERVQQIRPKVHLFGHVHGKYGWQEHNFNGENIRFGNAVFLTSDNRPYMNYHPLSFFYKSP